MSVGSIKYEREPPTKGSSQSPAIRGIFYILISGHSESVILFAEHHYARACGNGKNAKTCNAYSTGYRGLGYGSRCGLCCGLCGFCGLCGINRLIRGLYGLLGDFNRLIAAELKALYKLDRLGAAEEYALSQNVGNAVILESEEIQPSFGTVRVSGSQDTDVWFIDVENPENKFQMDNKRLT